MSQEQIDALLDRFQLVATVVDPQLRLDVVEKNPDDNCVLECAVASGAAYIVSGNTHLLELKEYEEIVVLDPASFVTLSSCKIRGSISLAKALQEAGFVIGIA